MGKAEIGSRQDKGDKALDCHDGWMFLSRFIDALLARTLAIVACVLVAAFYYHLLAEEVLFWRLHDFTRSPTKGCVQALRFTLLGQQTRLDLL